MKADAKSYVCEDNGNLWDFGVLEQVDFLNANHIHPLKQKELQQIINLIKIDEHVVGLIVFGSSTEFRCNSYSDIDLFVVTDDDSNELQIDITNTKSELDILYSKNAGERLKKVLKEHGVLVYERKD